MAGKKSQDKKSPKPKKSSIWTDFHDASFKRLKRLGIIPSSVKKGTVGAVSRLRNLVKAGFSSVSQWLTLPGDKKRTKALAQEYERAGHIVRNGKVMINPTPGDKTEVLRMDKKTGMVHRYNTDLKSGARVRSTISLALTDDEIPPLGKNQWYRIAFARGKGRRLTMQFKYFASLDVMLNEMNNMYSRFTDWVSHYEIVDIPKSSPYYVK